MNRKTDFDLNPAFLNAAELFLSKYEGYKDAIQKAENVNYKIGSYPYNDLLDNLNILNLISKDYGSYYSCPLEYKNFNLKQYIFLTYIKLQNPDWAIRFTQGLDSFEVDESAFNEDKTLRQCLDEVELLKSPLSDNSMYLLNEILDFIYATPATLNKIKLGRIGEDMSMKYEFQSTGIQPFQKSLWNSRAGYDIESYYPKEVKKHIEVKASRKGEANISINEWIVALDTASRFELYEFHFWKKEKEIWKLAIIYPDDLMFLGKPKRNNHHWTNFVVKFESFSDRFIEINFPHLGTLNHE